MRKRTMILLAVFAVVLTWSATAFAADSNSAVTNFFNGVGGFLYNALPWNWGNWWGK